MDITVKATYKIKLGGVEFDYYETERGTFFPIAPICEALQMHIPIRFAQVQVRDHEILGKRSAIIYEFVCLTQEYFGGWLCLLRPDQFPADKFSLFCRVVKDFFMIYDPDIFHGGNALHDIHKQILAVQVVLKFLKKRAADSRGKLAAHYQLIDEILLRDLKEALQPENEIK